MLIFYLCFPVLRSLVFSKFSGGSYFMIAILVMMIVYVFFKHNHRKHGYFDIILLYLAVFFLFLIKFIFDET